MWCVIMSLVIAKQDENQIYLTGDTKLSYADVAGHPEQKVASPQDSVIKVSIIHPSLCICFAGDVGGVDDLIKFCRNVADSQSDTKQIGLHSTRNAMGRRNSL